MPTISPPSFESMLKTIDEMAFLTKEIARVEIDIKLTEANIVKRVTTEPEFFKAGKPPAMELIKVRYLFTGIDNELIPKRAKLSLLEAKQRSLQYKFDLYKMIFDAWRTESANERKL